MGDEEERGMGNWEWGMERRGAWDVRKPSIDSANPAVVQYARFYAKQEKCGG